VSLYLRWVEVVGAGLRFGGRGVNGLLNLFSGSFSSFDGWGIFGQAAALCALAVVAGAGLSLLRPQLKQRRPLASCAGALLSFALLNAGETRGAGRLEAALYHLHARLGPGAYIGVASAAAACIAVAVVRREELTRRPSITAVAAASLTVGLLAAFLLPWLHVRIPRLGRGGATGYDSSFGQETAVFIVALACFGLPLWRKETSPGRRLAAAVGIAVLTAGSLSVLGTHVHWPYEAWLQLGCSLGLVVLARAAGRGLRTRLPSVPDAVLVFAVSLLVVSLFLPWQKGCGGGACVSASGWTQADSETAGGLAVLLVVFLLGFRRQVVELAVGAALYTTAAGFVVTQFARLGYGAPLGFAGAALLLLAAARRIRRVPLDRGRLVRIVPSAACLAFLAIPVATLTGRLSQNLEVDSPWRVFWLEVGAVLVAVRLLGRWLSGTRDDAELMLLPLALLAVTALDLIVARRELGTITWEGWASVGLCVLLAVLGWIERSRGLKGFRIPDEIWRIDRLPNVEG
jgi:hypothetical protein